MGVSGFVDRGIVLFVLAVWVWIRYMDLVYRHGHSEREARDGIL